MLDITKLKTIMPDTTRGAVFIGPLVVAMEEFGIMGAEQQARFLANVGHETGGLSVFEENLNYSAERLPKVWPKRFPTLASTQGYARNPVALANKVYANRMGNGDEKSGDGWRYRGAGMLQLTGRDNQAACGRYFGVPLDQVGDWLRTPAGAARSAAWFYTENGLHHVDTFDHVCDRINLGRDTDRVGDSIGWEDRLAMYQRALKALA
ncbi:MAG: glycoside hydrolase family 19 protein [Pseudomonadota bacterium]